MGVRHPDREERMRQEYVAGEIERANRSTMVMHSANIFDKLLKDEIFEERGDTYVIKMQPANLQNSMHTTLQ